jgi:hypothetical protein
MRKYKKVAFFIAVLIIIIFLNIILLIFEAESGLRISRWVTFVLPLIISYYVILKGNDDKSKSEGDKVE